MYCERSNIPTLKSKIGNLQNHLGADDIQHRQAKHFASSVFLKNRHVSSVEFVSSSHGTATTVIFAFIAAVTQYENLPMNDRNWPSVCENSTHDIIILTR